MTERNYDFEHIPQILDNPTGATWFGAKLLRLIASADDRNRELLRKAYPEHVAAFEDWYHQRGFYAPKAVSSSAQADMQDHVGRGERGNTSADSAVGSLILGGCLALVLLWAIGFGVDDVATWGELVSAVWP